MQRGFRAVPHGARVGEKRPIERDDLVAVERVSRQVRGGPLCPLWFEWAPSTLCFCLSSSNFRRVQMSAIGTSADVLDPRPGRQVVEGLHRGIENSIVQPRSVGPFETSRRHVAGIEVECMGCAEGRSKVVAQKEAVRDEGRPREVEDGVLLQGNREIPSAIRTLRLKRSNRFESTNRSHLSSRT